MNESYSIPWFYSDSWNIPRPMNPSIGPSSRGRTQFVSERWNSRKGTDHPHHQVQHSSPNASSPRVVWRETDPFILMQRIFDTGIILCQHAAGTGDTHCFGGYCQCQQKCMIHDPKSTFHHSWSCVSATATKTCQENVKRFSDSLILAVLSLSLSPPYLKYVSYMKPLWNPPRVFQIQSQPKSNQKEARKSIPYAANMK